MLADPRLDDYKVIKDERTREGEGIRIANNSGTLIVLDDPSDAAFAFIPQDGVEETPPEFPKRTSGTEKVIVDRARFERLLRLADTVREWSEIDEADPDYEKAENEVLDYLNDCIQPGDLDPIP